MRLMGLVLRPLFITSSTPCLRHVTGSPPHVCIWSRTPALPLAAALKLAYWPLWNAFWEYPAFDLALCGQCCGLQMQQWGHCVDLIFLLPAEEPLSCRDVSSRHVFILNVLSLLIIIITSLYIIILHRNQSCPTLWRDGGLVFPEGRLRRAGDR